MNQRTIAEKISCTGIGLHSGEPVQLTLAPARAGSGIVFVRTDLPEAVEIPARPGSVASTQYATTLGRGAATVGTVEHLLAAVYSLGVDNLRVEVHGPEVPVMDGSSASFVFLLRAAGLFEQPAARPRLRVQRPLEIRDGDRFIRIEPARELRISYAIDYLHPAIGRQSLRDLVVDGDTFEQEICQARTFGFLHEVQTLWQLGLARGGNLDNTVVLDEERVLNRDGVRFPDEFVRHKVLDLIGDLALLGMPIEGHVHVERGGHALHQRLLSELLANQRAWRVVDPAPHAHGEAAVVAAAAGLS
jgi:UDP-3-O-[3-hydroxymyristoyl] N-acetylglucosamine deacetylase